jgi:hypothetical protein
MSAPIVIPLIAQPIMDSDAERGQTHRHHHRCSHRRMHRNDVKMIIIVVLGVIVMCYAMVLANRMSRSNYGQTPAGDPSDVPTDLVR